MQDRHMVQPIILAGYCPAVNPASDRTEDIIVGIQYILQYLMGHSDISVTMNTYTHLGLEDAVDEMNRMQQLESARKEQEALSGKTDEVKLSKKHFRAG